MFGLRTQYGNVAMDVPDSAEQVGIRIGRAREGSCNRKGRKRLNHWRHTAIPTRNLEAIWRGPDNLPPLARKATTGETATRRAQGVSPGRLTAHVAHI